MANLEVILSGRFYMVIFVHFICLSLWLYRGGVFCIAKTKNGYNNAFCFAKNKAKRLLVPYWSVSVILFITLWVTEKSEGNLIWYWFKNVFLFDQVKHLWFLGALFFIFIIFNYLEKYVHKTIWLPIGLMVLYFSHVYMPWIFQISSICKYLVFFYLGYFFQLKSNLLLPFIERKSFFYVFFLLHICLYIASLKATFSSHLYILISYICSVLGCCFAISYNSLLLKLLNNGIERFVRYAVKNSFSVYLFHDIIIYLLFYYISFVLVSPAGLGVVVLLCSVTGSILFAVFLRKVRLKWIIGE